MMENSFNKERYVAPPEDRFEEKYSDKSRVIAGTLALLLGTFGIHSFYLGNTKKGLIQLLFAITGILTLASTIWGMYDAICLFIGRKYKDGDGNILL